MILAALRDTPYNIVLVLHLIAVIVGFSPAVAHSVMSKQARALDDGAFRTVSGFLARNSLHIYGNALIVAGLLGFALSGMSGGVYGVTDTWMLVSIVAWIALVGVLHGLLIPAEKAVAAGDDAAEARVAIGGAVMTILGLLVLVLMVFKPGA